MYNFTVWIQQEFEEPYIEDDSAFADVSADIIEVEEEEQESPELKQQEEEQIYDVEDSEGENGDGEDEEEMDEATELREATDVISQQIALGGSRAVARRRASIVKQPTPLWQRIFGVALFLAILAITWIWSFSVLIMFC